MENATSHGRAAVCLSCQARGFSPKDTTAYPCVNGCNYGHLKFGRDALYKYKSKGTPAVCTPCQERLADIKKKLARRDAWKCTCHRHHGHAEKCPLHPQFAGERRWPGKNIGLPEDDYDFYKTWKKK